MSGKRFQRALLCTMIAVFALIAGAGSASAWWDGKWKYRKKILLNTTAQGADTKEALADFPVLVRLHSGNFSFGNAKNDGADIRLVALDDKTTLKYHIERYDAKEEMAFIWVKVPRLAPASSQDAVWLYYGNSGAADGQESGGTYDTPQLVVYHFGEKEGAPRDVTAYGNNAKEFIGKLETPAIIGRGATLKGEGDRMVIARTPSLNFSKGFTFSAWIKPARSQQDARLFSWDDGKQSIIIGIDGTRLYCAVAGQGKKAAADKGADLTPQKWIHVAVTAEPGKDLKIYTGGKERNSARLASGGLPEPVSDIAVGSTLQGKNPFAGDIDEVEIAGISRTPEWIGVSAIAQGPETPLLSYMEEESTSGAESLTLHLLAVTARAITLDGWIIIGMIIIMIGWTWILFANKFMALRRTKRGDSAFFESFNGEEDIWTMKDLEEEFSDSSLYRIYRAGLEELEKRIERLTGTEKKTLPSQAITTFRAALDKAIVQESKINTSGLIYFTMSISGGPFMGLFGTVWGVINTFAGVAEAGEANLAAIAPGVASALACTLMGLALAIPALFQYNFLSADIKNNTADMYLFATTFGNRVEEEYGGKE